MKTFSAQGGDCNYRHVSQAFTFVNSASCAETIEAGQIDIHQNQVGQSLFRDADSILAIHGGDDLVALLLQCDANHCQVVYCVVHDEY